MPVLTRLDSLTSNWAGLLTILALVFLSLILLIEVIHWRTEQHRRRIAAELLASFCKGWRRGWRGYFAPLHREPWKSAWSAWRAPEGSWSLAVGAWFKAIEVILDEPADATIYEEEP